MARDFLTSSSESVGARLMKFLARDHPFSENYFSDPKGCSPSRYWKGGFRLGFQEDLAKIAIPLVSAACTPAELERQFSTLSLTYGKLRTNLGTEKTGKLAFLFRHLNR